MEQFILQLGIMSFQAGVAICAVLLVRALFDKLNVAKKFADFLWAIPYLCMVCPWKFESAFGFWRQPQSSALIRIQQIIRQVQYNLKGQTVMDAQADGLQEAAQAAVGSAAGSAGAAGITVVGNTDFTHTALGNTAAGSLLTELAQSTTASADSFVSAADVVQILLLIAGIVWIAGVLALLFYSANAHLQLHKKLICCMKLKENIYLVDGIATPFVLGIRKPRIYLPSDMPKEGLEYVLAHERTHIRRKDPLKKMLVFGITCLHWFNPLAWVAFYYFTKDMEMACDEVTVESLGVERRQDYAAALLHLTVGKKFSLGAPLAFKEGNVKDRIKNIVKVKEKRRLITTAAVVVIVLLGATRYCFSEDYTAVWSDSDVKASLSHQLEAPQAVKDFLENILEEAQESAEVEQKTAFSAEIAAGLELIGQQEPHELTMEELLALNRNGTLKDVMAALPFAEEMLYTNLVLDDDNSYALNYTYSCDLVYEGKIYRFRTSYNKPEEAAKYGYEEHGMFMVYLTHADSGDMCTFYTDRNPDIVVNLEEFLNLEYDIEQYFTMTLPEGTWLSNYRIYFNDVISGSVIEGDFEELPHDEEWETGWHAPGGVGIMISDGQTVFENGELVSVAWRPNHSSKSGPVQIDGCAKPAVMYKFNHDLFTASSWIEYCEEHDLPLDTTKVSSTADFWYIFMADEDDELLYVVYLNQAFFTKEDVLELARSVKFRDD